MSGNVNAGDVLHRFVAWLVGLNQQPPDDFPVLILVTDPTGQRVLQWRLQRMSEAVALVTALKQAQIEEDV